MTSDLRLIALSSIEHQEYGDPPRVQRLVDAFGSSHLLHDPVIVTKGIHKPYLQIDGITRISALKKLGCSHVVGQYVRYLDPSQVRIKSWVHVSRVNELLFLQQIMKQFPGKTESFKLGLGVTLASHPLAAVTILFRNGKGLSILNGRDIHASARITNQVIRLYGSFIERDHQVTIESMSQLADFFNQHPLTNVALFFPNYQPSDLYKLMRLRTPLPQGLTRHIIDGRVLGIDYPIDRLMKSVTPTAKKKFFETFMRNLRLRYYEESTYVKQ